MLQNCMCVLKPRVCILVLSLKSLRSNPIWVWVTKVDSENTIPLKVKFLQKYYIGL